MARKPTSNAWQWSRSAETRRVLLEAAREVFAVHGYDGASIADVVERAGSSVQGARAYFDGAWEQRDVARLFMTGDGPPGFEMMRRTRGHEWIRQNAVLLEAGTDPVDRMTVAVLTTIIGETAREIAASSSRREANALAAAAVTLIRRLDPLRPVSPGPQ